MKYLWLCTTGLFLVLQPAGVIREANAAEPEMRLLVPAYFYPAGKGLQEWDKLCRSTARAHLVAIVNPASGPGKAVDPNYVAVVKRARQAGVTLIGYVTTSYAKRPLAGVRADVDQWLRLYPGIQGIFFDEQASGDEQVAYQAALYTYVKKEKRLDLVVTNPGTVCAEGYLLKPAADAVCLFEGPLPAEGYRLPPWASKTGAGRIVVLPYKVATRASMRECLADAVARHAGWVYITDAAGANPWERLPSYWDDESAALLEINSKSSPRSTHK